VDTFRLAFPAHVSYGIDSINRLAGECARYGNRILVVTESLLHEERIIETVLSALDKKGLEYICYDEISPESNVETAKKIRALIKVSHSQLIVGLGGIKTTSLARFSAAAAETDGDIFDLLDGGSNGLETNPLPYIEIPTSIRNPFLFTNQVLIKDSRTGRGVIGELSSGIVKAIILDPKLSFSLSFKSAAAILMDILLMSVEGYISNKSTFISDAMFIQAFETIRTAVNAAVENKNDNKFKVLAANAGLLMAFGLSASSMGAGSALGYVLGTGYRVPKSWISGIILPYIIEFCIGAAPEKISQIARHLGEVYGVGTTAERAALASETVRRFLPLLDLPTRLRDLQLKNEQLYDAAEAAASYRMVTTMPLPTTADDLSAILKQSY
jgi:alcohol dehydrogenase class IV